MRRCLCGLSLVVVLGTVLLTTAPASAHERRTVGKYGFVVGWGDEPAYTGFKNSIELILSGPDGKPVTDLGDALEVEVAFGTEKTTLDLEPNFVVGIFGDPGDYRAWLTPTRAGTYSFRFTGAIRGDKIDATFTCSETTFDCITDVSEIQFPVKDPSTPQLTERLERESERAATRIGAVGDDADRATKFGYVGIGLGTLGVVLAVVLRRKAR